MTITALAEPEFRVGPNETVTTHYSALTAHRECGQKWFYRYHLGLRFPDNGPKPEMHFGSWWGLLTAIEAAQRGRALGSLVAEPRPFGGVDDGPVFDPRVATVRDVLEAANAWWKTRDYDTREAWYEKLGEGLPKRLLALYKRWMDEHAAARKNELPMGLEVFWERNLPKREDGLGPDIRLIGFIDEIYFDVERGIVVVRDRKSHKVLKPTSALSDLMDSQLHLYAWGAEELVLSWGRGPIRAVSYDRARSVAPRQPEITKTAGALSKSVTDYDLATYRAFAATDTRPVPELEKLRVEKARTLETAVPETSPAVLDELREQIAHLDRVLATPGQFWGELAFLISGARKGKPKFGVHEIDSKMVEKLSTPAAQTIWFQRTRVPLNRNVIATHLEAAADTALDAWNTRMRGIRTGAGPRNLGKPCDFCDYDALCRSQMMGGGKGDYELAEFGLVAKDPSMRFLSEGVLTPGITNGFIHDGYDDDDDDTEE